MTVYSKIPEVSIENIHDLNIWQKELSHLKLGYNLSKLNCAKNNRVLYAYLRSHLGSSIKKEYVESLIESWNKVEKIIVVTDNSFELTDKFSIYMKEINKSIKRFQKKRHDEFMNEFVVPHTQQSTPMSKTTEEVNGDATK